MRNLTVMTGALVLVLSRAMTGAAQDAGQGHPLLPGSFQTLAVNGPKAGRYECPVCDSGVNPGILIFFKDPQEGDKVLAPLLKRLDEVLGRRPGARMSGFAVCLSDGSYREALVSNSGGLDQAISRKDALARRLKDLGQTLELKQMSFGLGMTPEAIKEYGLKPDAYATVVVYYKQEIVGTFTFGQEAPDEKELDRAVQAADAVSAEADRVGRPARRRREATSSGR